MNLRIPLALFGLVTSLALAPAAHAQELGIQFKKRNVSIGLTLGNACAPAPGYAARPVPYARREWVPSHHETVYEQVWIPGREERVYVPAVTAWRQDHCGRPYQVVVCPAHYETRCTPGRYETVAREVWVEGGWRVKHCR